MVETDGPWAFDGPFLGKMTHPAMTQQVVQQLASYKGYSLEDMVQRVYGNTVQFYGLDY